jgi:hypothetical protein
MCLVNLRPIHGCNPKCFVAFIRYLLSVVARDVKFEVPFEHIVRQPQQQSCVTKKITRCRTIANATKSPILAAFL